MHIFSGLRFVKRVSGIRCSPTFTLSRFVQFFSARWISNTICNRRYSGIRGYVREHSNANVNGILGKIWFTNFNSGFFTISGFGFIYYWLVFSCKRYLFSISFNIVFAKYEYQNIGQYVKASQKPFRQIKYGAALFIPRTITNNTLIKSTVISYPNFEHQQNAFLKSLYTYLGIFREAVNFPFIAISNAIRELFTWQLLTSLRWSVTRLIKLQPSRGYQ